MNKSKFIIYGLGGPEEEYRVIRYWVINSDQFSIGYAKFICDRLRGFYPSIKEVYLLDDRWGLLDEYRESDHGGMADKVIFRDTIMNEGLRLDI